MIDDVSIEIIRTHDWLLKESNSEKDLFVCDNCGWRISIYRGKDVYHIGKALTFR